MEKRDRGDGREHGSMKPEPLGSKHLRTVPLVFRGGFYPFFLKKKQNLTINILLCRYKSSMVTEENWYHKKI